MCACSRGGSVLLTVSFLDGFHGSAIQTYEYAKQFANLGFKVFVGCIFASNDVESLFSKAGVKVFCITKDLPQVEFDIVWAFHSALLSYLFYKGVRAKKVVNGTFSPYEPIETFCPYWKKLNFLTAHSGRTRELHSIYYAIPLEKIFVFPNPIPDEFFNCKFCNYINQNAPKKIAVVSNHVVPELRELKNLLLHDAKISFYGEKDEYVKITPQILLKHDCIISIGKTVQYALGLGIPVFEYDKFGGCGYIFLENYEREKFRNFCGLATERKLSAVELKNKIFKNYARAKKEAEKLKGLAERDFLLSRQIEQFLSHLDECPELNLSIEKLSHYKLEIMRDVCFVKCCENYEKKLFDERKAYPLAKKIADKIPKWAKRLVKKMAGIPIAKSLSSR